MGTGTLSSVLEDSCGMLSDIPEGAGGGAGVSVVGEGDGLLETPLKIPSERDSLRASREVDLSSPPSIVSARNRKSPACRCT